MITVKMAVMVGIVLVVIAALVAAVSLSGFLSRLSPDELAVEYINGNIDDIGEDIAGFMVGNNWALKELGGEYVEEQIHKVVKWDYTPARLVGDDRYEVIATAIVIFDVDLPIDIPLTSGDVNVEVRFPFILDIDHSAQTVSSSPNFEMASFATDIPELPPVDVPDVSLDKAKDVIEESIPTNCIDAARDAGVPDSIIELIEKSSDERSGLERTVLRRGLDAAGLSSVCADIE